MNPFSRLYATCNAGTNGEKMAGLASFPSLIDVELTNACNFRCLMCPTGNKAMRRVSGFMPAEVWARLLDECREWKPALRFIGWGEPTLHPRLSEFVWQASQAGMLTHINTNGSKLTESLAVKLIDAGLDSIKFSFQGVDRKSYAEMRNTDFFDGLLEVVGMVWRLGNGKPYIQVSTTTTYEPPEQVEEFKNLFGQIADQVTVGKTIFSHMDMGAVRLRPDEVTRLASLSAFEPKLKHPDPCPEVFDKLTVQWDGSVRVCCNDYDGITNLGNILEKPLAEIWRAKTIEDYRASLAGNNYSGPLCANCWNYIA